MTLDDRLSRRRISPFDVVAVALLAVLTPVSAVLGWLLAPGPGDNLDADAFVRESREIASSGSLLEAVDAMLSTPDPPLRYLPFSVLLDVVGPVSTQTALRVGSAHAWVASLAVCSLVAWVLLRRLLGPREALLGLVVVLSMHALSWGHLATGTGRWMDGLTYPFVYLGILGVYETLRRDSSIRFAVASGAAFGVAALLQPGLVAVVIPLLSVAFLLRRRVREWLATGAAGAVVTLPATLLASSGYHGRVGGSVANKLARPEWILPTLESLVRQTARLEVAVVLVALVVAMLAVDVDEWRLDDAGVLPAVVVGFGLLYVPMRLQTLLSVAWLERLTPLVLAAIAAQVLATLEARRVDVDEPTSPDVVADD